MSSLRVPLGLAVLMLTFVPQLLGEGFEPPKLQEREVATAPGIVSNLPVPVADEDAPVGITPTAPSVDMLTSFRSAPVTSGGALWSAAGPGPTLNGQVENIVPNDEVVGAVHVVIAHPVDPDIIYVGGANGGIWMTTNGLAVSPHWEPLTDSLSSLSIGALEFDPTDPTGQTLIAGIGRFSSFGSAGGPRAGLLRSIDGGASWSVIDDGGNFIGRNISGVKARGSIIVASVNYAENFTFSEIGIFRSTNAGASFTQISSGSGAATGLPGGLCFDLASDPVNPAVLYTVVKYADVVGGTNGIYKSTDTGATWAKVSDAAIDALIVNSDTGNVEISVGQGGAVYVAILNFGQLRNGGVFQSSNGGATWTAMDIPLTNETGGDVGTNPRFKPNAGEPGGQGSIHFSIVADPGSSDLVYVGGDRQPAGFDDLTGFPNAIGAFDYSGRLFRGDFSQPTGSQWVHLTHSDSLGAVGGGTFSSSAPHADSREMCFDALGDILETDDGGVYRRTSPQDNTGDWFSINGDLQTTEFHDIAYDANADIIIGGAQDTGSPQQLTPGSTTWDSVSTADGGDVAVDDISVPGQSFRYTSSQNIGGFRKRTYDANNNLLNETFPGLLVGGVSSLRSVDPNVRFLQPIKINAVDGQRSLVLTRRVYESFDQFETLTDITGDQGADISATAYGGSLAGVPVPGVLYYGLSGGALYRRTTSGGGFTQMTNYPGGTPNDIALDPTDWRVAVVIDDTDVYVSLSTSSDAWISLTANLSGVGILRNVEFIDFPGTANDLIVVAADAGVFMRTMGVPLWTELGDNLPNAPVFDMEYDSNADVLVVGTLGRGAWRIDCARVTLGGFTVDDATAFTNCLLGPDGGLSSGCACFDTNFDGQIDLLEFAAFQQQIIP